MKKVIFIAILFLLVFAFLVQAQEEMENIVGIELLYESGDFSIEDLYFDFGYKTKNIDNFNFVLKTLDNDRNILDELYVNLIEISMSADPNWFDNETGEQVVIPEIDEIAIKETFFMPYRENITYISIFDRSGEELVTFDVAEFSLFCGDFICQSYEDINNCPQDCYVDDKESVDSSTEKSQEDEETKLTQSSLKEKLKFLENNLLILYIFGGVLIFIILMILILKVANKP